MKTTLLRSKYILFKKYFLAILILGSLQTNIYAQSSNVSLNFDGIDDYVSFGTTKLNNIKSVTFAAWIYRTGNNGIGNDEIIAKENVVSFAINNSNGKLRLNFGNGTTWGTEVESNIDIPLNTWVHLAGGRDFNTGTISVFINGANVGTANNSLFGSNTNEAALGFKPGALSEDAAFEGSIDEVRIWGKSLCVPEITSYSTGMVTTALPQMLASISFEQGIANDDNTTLTAVTDITGNYNGTLNNFELTGSVSNFVAGNASITGTSVAYPLVSPIITTAGGTSICTGSSLPLSTTPAFQYYWSNGWTSAVCNATTAGTYFVTTYDNNGCNSQSPSVTLNLASSFSLTSVAYTSGSTSFCRGLNQMISVRVNYSPTGSKSFQLQLSTDSTFSTINYTATSTLTGGVGTLTFAGTTVRLWPAGKYYARVTSSCITNGSLSLAPINIWGPLVMQAVSNSPVCSGDPLQMNATDGASSYSWAGPGGFSAAVKSATLNSESLSSGTYTVTASNGCGTYTGSTSIVINAIPTLDITTTNASCPGASNGSVVLSSSDSNTPLTYFMESENTDIPVFSNLQAGSYLIGLRNSKGCKLEQLVSISDQDETAPVAKAKDIIINLDAEGNAFLEASQVDNGSYDVCGIQSMVVEPSNFNIGQVGTNLVTLTVTDNTGNISQTTAIVTVKDITAPSLEAYPSLQIALGSEGVVSVSPSELVINAIDASGIAQIQLSKSEFDCSTIGENVVTLTVIDNNGNSTSLPINITVIDNTTPILSANSITAYLNETGSVSVSPEEVNSGSSDACGIQSMTLSQTTFNCSIQSLTVTPTSFNCANAGENIVTLTAIDPAGNTTSATAIVTISGTSFATTKPAIYINQANKVNWVNVPSITNGSSSVITSTPTFNGNLLTLTATGGNISSSSCTGIGVTGSGTSVVACGGVDYMNQTVNKSQTIKATLNNSTLGITSLSFRSAYTGKVMVNGRRNGQTVITFSKYMTANDFDTFDFTTACALRGICTIDEVEFKLSERTSGCVRRWNQYEDNENTDYEDGTNLTSNCGFTIQDMVLNVKQKDECNIGSIGFSWDNGVFASKVVGVSDNLSTGTSNVHSLASNSDGNFTSGSPFSNNSAKRLVVGYNWLGLASAWEVTSQCKLRNIRQGLLSNIEVLPTGGNALTLLVFEFKITSVSSNGQFIYGTRTRRSNGSMVDIRWRVNEFYQRVWISNPQVIQYSKTGETEIEDEDGLMLMDEATNEFGDLNVSIYPNPSIDVFRFKIESGSMESFSVELFDMMGRLIQENKDLNAAQEIAIGENLKAGVYLVKVTQGTQVKFAKVTRLN